MSQDMWTVSSHIIPASHIRGFSRGVRDEQTGSLRLAVKQYVPRNRNFKTGEITLIAAQGVGQAKELYEPFFDGLLEAAKLPIRAIWILDNVHYAASYVLNEHVIGDEHHWLDSSRDLLQMVNYFQSQMPPPIYGMGQSWGAATITMASIMHPRLFSGIVSVEAVMGTGYKLKSWLDPDGNKSSVSGALRVMNRRDFWPTREEARRRLSNSPFFGAFDPQVFDLSVRYDLRDCPTAEHPQGVCLATPKSLQVATTMVPDPPLPNHPPGPEYVAGKNNVVVPGFYRGEVEQVQRSLPFVYPPVLYLWGKKSKIGMSDYATMLVNRTGIELGGGSGGVAKGQVKSLYMDNVAHTVVLEKPREAAVIVGSWMREQHIAWSDREKAKADQAPFKPSVINPLWYERIAKI